MDIRVIKKHFIEFVNIFSLIGKFYRYRHLLANIAYYEYKKMYQNTFGGCLWSIIQPLFMIGIYTTVFSFFLRIKFVSEENHLFFAINLLCGLLPWYALSESLSSASIVVEQNSNLVRNVVFPLEIFPISLAVSSIIKMLIGLIIFIPFVWWITKSPSWTAIFVPIIFLLQLLLISGLNLFVASLSVYLPDIKNAISVLLTVWLFLTPIFYPENYVPRNLSFLLKCNPMANLVALYRDTIIQGITPNPTLLAWTALQTAFIFLFGHFWFMRTKGNFADLL